MYFERGEVITRMRRKRVTEFVTSDEMTLREFYGAQSCTSEWIFNQNYSENKFLNM